MRAGIIKKITSIASDTTTTITQETIATFLEKGRYDYHLRKLRQTLHSNSLKYLGALQEYFPKETLVSNPSVTIL